MWINGIWYSLLDENVEGGDLPGGDADPAPAAGADPAPADPAPAAGADPAPADPAPAADKPGDWPSDWRTKLSPDGKHAKTLDRFSSPNAILDSYLSLRQKLDSGEIKAVVPFPNQGTEEEQTAWRKAHGIPNDPEEYSLQFPDGLVIGEVDKPFVDSFLKKAHSTNMPPEQVNEVLHWYYTEQEQMYAKQEENDAKYQVQAEDTLRAEWGGEYRTNINVIRGLVDTLPESIRDAFMGSRLGDGTVLLNHPDMARWLVHTAKTINPVATVVPGAGANVAGAIDDEIESIEKVMRENREAYNRDEKMQQRLRDLYDARERAK